MKRFVVYTALSAFCLLMLAEDVSNVKAYQEGKNIVIEYDLSKKSEVKVSVSIDNGQYKNMYGVSGDVNKTIQSGHHKIIWDVLSQYNKFYFDNVRFKVENIVENEPSISVVQVTNKAALNSVTDCQGNTYPVVKISDQYWMAENLRCTKYDTQSERAGAILGTSNIGSREPYYTDVKNATTEFSGRLISNQLRNLGLLYNWAAAVGLASENAAKNQTASFRGTRQGICPNGWHVPTCAEWSVLENYVGADSGKKLKTTLGWESGGNGTDAYSFAALSAGYAYGSSVYNVGYNAYFWAATPSDEYKAYYCYLNYSDDNLLGYSGNKGYARSVRCVKD